MSFNKRLSELSQEAYDWQTWRDAAYRRASELLAQLGHEMVQKLRLISDPRFGLFSLSAARGRLFLHRVDRPSVVLIARGWRCGRFFVDTRGSMYLWHSVPGRYNGSNTKYLDEKKVLRALEKEVRRHGLSSADVIDSFDRLVAGESGLGQSLVDIHGWSSAGMGNLEFLISAETTSLEYSNFESQSRNLVDDLSLGLLGLQQLSAKAL